MSLLIISDELIKAKLQNLSVCKSVGPDGIHPRFLKELATHLCKPLGILFNKSLNESKLPNEWKQAKVSVIFKKGSRKQAGNYRPVSLTSIVCKIMESCVRDHIVDHMSNNSLFSTQQYGFINGRSTSLQLMCTEALDKRFSIYTVYIDFRKAFDCV